MHGFLLNMREDRSFANFRRPFKTHSIGAIGANHLLSAIFNRLQGNIFGGVTRADLEKKIGKERVRMSHKHIIKY